MGVIYKITSPSNKLYVGKTYDLNKRIASHKCATKKGSNIILHNSIRKYGWEAHILEIIEECGDELLNEREIHWITEFKTYCYDNPNGLNMTKGGDGQRSTWMHDTERRNKQSNSFMGIGNPFFGKKHTEEYKKQKSKVISEYNIKVGKIIPKWGAEKGRQIVMKPILCYDYNGNFIKEYASATEASLSINLNRGQICRVCRGQATNAGGFIFKYKTENYKLKIEVGKVVLDNIKRPVLTLSPDFEVLCEHPSAQEASEFWGVPKTTINRAAQYNWLKPIRSGHVFIYKDLYAEIEALTA